MSQNVRLNTHRFQVAGRRLAPIAALVAINLAVGFLLTPHYGQSTDEWANLIFARDTLASYQHPDQPYRDVSREDKGPFYLMVWLKAGEFLDRVIPGWAFVDGRHFTNFLTFQLAIVSVYVLALRFVGPGAALAGALLFETQPVFFGHAFINQKDTPFTGFFAMTVVLGLGAADAFSRAGPAGADRAAFGDAVRGAWAEDPRRGRRASLSAAAVALAVPMAGILFYRPLAAWVGSMVRAAYLGKAWGPVNQLFQRFAEHAGQVPVEDYVQRGQHLLTVGILMASIAMVVVALVAAGKVWPKGGQAARIALIADLRRALRSPLPLSVWPAAVIFGMCIAIRTTALYAGLLVAGYALVRAGPRIAILLAVYFGAAAVVAYAAWPQLWGSPLATVVASVDRTLQFPQLHRTLIEGVIYQSNALPVWYLPVVMAIQFTLPAGILALAGLVPGVRSALRGPAAATAWVLLLWFLTPFAFVVVFRTPIYNYFRHVLFIMPPLFVMAAMMIDRLLRLMRTPIVGGLLAIGLVLPGVAAIVRLFPYEYGYFNELVGGVRGAEGRYMSDYWCTSLREAMNFVNEHAPSSAGIAIDGPDYNATPFAREDLRVRDQSVMASDEDFQPVMVVGCSWALLSPSFFPEAPVLWTVEREGVPLAVVKLLTPQEPAAP